MAFINSCHEQEDLGKGRFRSTIAIKPVAYTGDDGYLRAIVPDWEQGDVLRPHVVNKAGMLLRMDGDGFLDIIPERRYPDRYFSIGAPYTLVGGVWTQVQLGQATRTRNAVWWSTAVADVGVLFAGHYVKPGTIRLKTDWRPPEGKVAFPVGLTGLTRSGNQLLRDGVPVLTMRAPHVEDLDNPDDVRPVAHEFLTVAGQAYVLLTLPTLETGKRWLIDPTLVLQPDASAGIDTMMIYSAADANYAKYNYGVGTGLVIGQVNPASSFIGRSLLRFDLSSISTLATCTSAVFRLTNSASASQTATVPVSVHYVTAANSTWIEGTKNGTQAGAGEPCWNAKAADGAGGVTTAWAGSAGCGTSGTDYVAVAMGTFNATDDPDGTGYDCSLDTTTVQGWFGITNNGMFCRSPETTAGAYFRAHSSDYATNTTYRPMLTTIYTLPGGSSKVGLLGGNIQTAWAF